MTERNRQRSCLTRAQVFISSALEGLSPVRCGDTGEPFPLYRLPVSLTNRADLLSWSSAYHHLDCIWLASGDLEESAYARMSAPDSELSTSGRELAALVELAAGIPTFYYMIRYYEDEEVDEDRLCPSCGQDWREDVLDEKAGQFQDFPFRCQPCRLVSHRASSRV